MQRFVGKTKDPAVRLACSSLQNLTPALSGKKVLMISGPLVIEAEDSCRRLGYIINQPNSWADYTTVDLWVKNIRIC